MDPAPLQRLLRDANLLAQYAARRGKLPEGNQALELVAAIDTVPPPPDRAALVARLGAEVDALARAIAPVSISQLTWRGSALGTARHVVDGISPFVIGFLTLMLTLYLAFQSSQLHQADTALRAFNEWVSQQPREKLYAAFKMYRYENVLNIKAPPLAQLDAYQKMVEDAHQLSAKGEAIHGLLTKSSMLLYVPPTLQEVGPDWLRGLARSLNGAEPDEVQQRSLPSFDKALALASPPTQAATPAPPRRPCADELVPAPGVRSVTRPPQRSLSEIDSYEASWACFLQRIQLDDSQISYSAWPVIFDLKLKINLLVTWLLPGLYGLLGACVYLMRDMIMTRNQQGTGTRSILNSLSLVLRVALGGLAGIIIGWFWVPGAVGNGSTVPQISSIPFGMAFLAGFSIETLFSMLDRLNRTIENREPKKA